jgi:hypothetical protein
VWDPRVEIEFPSGTGTMIPDRGPATNVELYKPPAGTDVFCCYQVASNASIEPYDGLTGSVVIGKAISVTELIVY